MVARSVSASAQTNRHILDRPSWIPATTPLFHPTSMSTSYITTVLGILLRILLRIRRTSHRTRSTGQRICWNWWYLWWTAENGPTAALSELGSSNLLITSISFVCSKALCHVPGVMTAEWFKCAFSHDFWVLPHISGIFPPKLQCSRDLQTATSTFSSRTSRWSIGCPQRMVHLSCCKIWKRLTVLGAADWPQKGNRIGTLFLLRHLWASSAWLSPRKKCSQVHARDVASDCRKWEREGRRSGACASLVLLSCLDAETWWRTCRCPSLGTDHRWPREQLKVCVSVPCSVGCWNSRP